MAVTKTINLDGGFKAPAYLMIGTVALDFLRETTTIDYVRFADKEARDAFASAKAAKEAALRELQEQMAVGEDEDKEQILEAHAATSAKLQMARAAERNSFGTYHYTATFDGLITDRATLYEMSKRGGCVLDQGKDA
jgi:hypothetical protein